MNRRPRFLYIATPCSLARSRSACSLLRLSVQMMQFVKGRWCSSTNIIECMATLNPIAFTCFAETCPLYIAPCILCITAEKERADLVLPIPVADEASDIRPHVWSECLHLRQNDGLCTRCANINSDDNLTHFFSSFFAESLSINIGVSRNICGDVSPFICINNRSAAIFPFQTSAVQSLLTKEYK